MASIPRLSGLEVSLERSLHGLQDSVQLDWNRHGRLEQVRADHRLLRRVDGRMDHPPPCLEYICIDYMILLSVLLPCEPLATANNEQNMFLYGTK